ncbi:sensor histidine kinase [Brevibacterium casei]|uniref:sensor histidine kinase n=1 Tax=Brevibacterium casei TaxID=33889 RepID=UPI0031590995
MSSTRPSPRHIRVPGLPSVDLEDLVTAIVLSSIGILFIVLGPRDRWFAIDIIPEAVALLVLVLCGFVGTLFASRVLVSTVSILAGLGVDLLSGGHNFALWLIFQLVFALVGHAPRPVAKTVSLAAGAVPVVTGLVAFALGAQVSAAFQFSLLAALIVFLPALWASSVREHRNTAEAQRARAEAERSRADAQTQMAVLAHRTAEVSARLAEQKVRAAAAEDLHDLVAGHISAIALQSQAALATGDEAVRARVLTTVHASADRALGELRRMIDVLSADTDTTDPAASVSETLALARGLGVSVTGEETLRMLDGAEEEALRPVFAELLANVVKHADPRELTITAKRPGTFVVANPVSAPDATGSGPGGGPAGSGLVGTGRGLENIVRRLHRLGGTADFAITAGEFRAVIILPTHLRAGTTASAGNEEENP